ncbi:hypothetical protein CHS0354_035680 [Potamilus streckersoni]|uniref:Chitin-binding type-2 domain-containing protein n=1 Tax=Potamilus streckersoni TaxID=2493646 RepID=A0AAE0VHS3_9BIVA|nr:hypothetical protein CHS0354_035680 [Potamilus streckersoni]
MTGIWSNYYPKRPDSLNYLSERCPERRNDIDATMRGMYTGESEARCSYMPQRTICQCVNTMDLNFDMCANLSDGLYAWPSRKLSRYYIQCLKGRTLPMICEGSSMVFDFQEKHCLLVYDEVSRLYNHTVLLPETTFADVPPLNIYVTQTRFVNDRYVSFQQSTLGFDFDYLISGAGGNSVGKQTFIPAFSQFIYAALTDGGVTQTNLVQERSLLFQQTSSVCVTNTLNSKSEKTLTVFNSYVATSVLVPNVDMTQTQFVPEKYTLFQPTGSTISLTPSTLAFGAFKSTSEIYPIHLEPLTSYIKKHFTTVPDSAMKTLFPVLNTLISQLSFFITESLSPITCIQNLYSSDPLQTPPNRKTKALTSTTSITNMSENSSGKRHWFDDFSSCEAVNTPLSDQKLDSKTEFLEVSVINYGTYLSAGRISKSEIISTLDYIRDSNVAENSFFQHLSTSYPLSELQGLHATNYLQLTNETYFFRKNLNNTVLARSFYKSETQQIQYLTMSELSQGNFGMTTYGNHISYTLGNNSPSSLATTRSTEFTTKHPSVMSDSTLILRTSAFLTTSETYFDRLSFRSQSQMHIFSPKVNANKGISRQNDPSIFIPPDLIDTGTGFSASKSGHQYGYSNTIFIRPDDTEIKVSRYLFSNLLSQIPKGSAQNMLSFSLFASTISRYFKFFSSQLSSLPAAILESTVSTTAGHLFIITEESDKGLSAFPLKITSDVSMHSRYHIKTVDRDISSLDQFGYLSLNPSPKLESSKTTFSTMNFMSHFISTITDSIQHTKANMVSKTALPTAFMNTTEAVKPNADTVETKMASSEASIFPSNLALSRRSSMSPISMARDLMRSELILDSSFIPVTPMNFPGLVNRSGTTVMDTNSLLRLFESLHSSRLKYSSSQASAFEVGGASSRSALNISPRSTPVIYDSQLSPSKLLEISPSKAITWLTTSIIPTSSSSVKIIQGNILSLISLTDIISSSAPDVSNFQSTESTKSRQNNITKLIISTNDKELNPLNLSHTSFIAVLVASCAGLSFFIILTTILIIHLRKKTKRKQYLQSG